jgi:hypothetical protein
MHIKSSSDSISPTSVKSIQDISPPDLRMKKALSKDSKPAQIVDDVLTSVISKGSSQKKRDRKQLAKKLSHGIETQESFGQKTIPEIQEKIEQ